MNVGERHEPNRILVPFRVGFRHRSNQCAYVRRHRRSSDTSATFPRPEQAEALTMPRDDGFRLDDDECAGQERDSHAQRHRSAVVSCNRRGRDRIYRSSMIPRFRAIVTA